MTTLSPSTIRHPSSTSSIIGRVDARWRLASLLCAAAVTASLRTLTASTAALIAALLLAFLARLPRRWFLQRLAALAVFLAVFALPLPWLLAADDRVGTWQSLHFSPHGLEIAVRLSVKAIAIVTLFLVAQAAAPLETNLKAAHALRIPSLLVQLGLLTYRYIFVLADELARLRIALRVRGYRNRVRRHSYRTAGHIAGTLLVRGYERAERIGQAMRCRGYDGQFRSLTGFTTRGSDIAVFVVIAGSAALLAVWDWLPRL